MRWSRAVIEGEDAASGTYRLMLENRAPGTGLKEENQAVLQRDACVTSALEGSKRAKLFEVPRGSPTSYRSMISLDQPQGSESTGKAPEPSLATFLGCLQPALRKISEPNSQVTWDSHALRESQLRKTRDEVPKKEA